MKLEQLALQTFGLVANEAFEHFWFSPFAPDGLPRLEGLHTRPKVRPAAEKKRSVGCCDFLEREAPSRWSRSLIAM